MRGGFQGAGRAAWLSAVGLGAAGAGLWAEGLAADEAGRSAVPPARSQRKPSAAWKEDRERGVGAAWCPSGATVGSGSASAQTSSPLGGCRPGSG